MEATGRLEGLRPLPDDVLVVDAVVHPFNLSPGNVASRYGQALWDMSYGMHAHFNPPGRCLPPEAYLADMGVDSLARMLFLESRVDVAVTHTLRLDGWFKDGFVNHAKTVEAVAKYPDRLVGYVGLDPTLPLETCVAELEAQVRDLPGGVGLKLYPHQVNPYRSWRADDPQVLELLRHARTLGIRTVAIHKALPNGPVPLAPYGVEDMEAACDALPDLRFEIIHAGMAFLEETAMALARFPNVYANLETTTALLWRAPGLFEDILGKLLFFGGPDRILFATGAPLVHPAHIVELFWNLELSDATRRKYGIDGLPDPVKRLILGENYARLLGRDPADMLAAARADAFAAELRANGPRPPFSTWDGVHASEAVA